MKVFEVLKFVLSHPLNRGRAFPAVSRVLRWQLASRLLHEAEFSLPFVNQTRMLVNRSGATSNFYCGLHEPDEMGFALHVLNLGDLFIDIGANVGAYTMLAASVGASVVAVEPIRDTYARLAANVRLNGFDSVVRAHRIGLSDTNGRLRFSTSQDSINHVLAPGEVVPATEVDVVTLDSLLAGQAPTLIKIDVEGHELPVLRGADKTLTSKTLLAVIVETNGSGLRYGIPDTDLYGFMAARDFEPFVYSGLGRALTKVDTSDGPAPENTVFLARTNIEKTKQRISTARTSTLVNASI